MSSERENRPPNAPKSPLALANEAGDRAVANRPYQPDRKRRSIKVDRVNPSDLARYDGRFYCDDCAHYSFTEKRCTMGYQAQHTKIAQMALYDQTGMMAFCRFLEID
jgi:hypothetical protein